LKHLPAIRRFALPGDGVTDRLWEIADIAKLVEDAEAKPAKRGPYKRLGRE
jgi:hypothetical protein